MLKLSKKQLGLLAPSQFVFQTSECYSQAFGGEYHFMAACQGLFGYLGIEYLPHHPIRVRAVDVLLDMSANRLAYLLTEILAASRTHAY
jgi:hypothetical protein